MPAYIFLRLHLWKRYNKGGSFLGLAYDLDGTPAQSDNLPHQCQAKTIAVAVAALVRLIKFFKNMFLNFFRHTNSRISNRYNRIAIGGTEADLYGAGGRGKFDGIGQQVSPDLCQHAFVSLIFQLLKFNVKI